ncbi:hypothetical protein [Neobacillus terrae]|uniref:hypothetical protein n=1 Tax=Neobacillus terrae TaxID=3034837 RepID=UPI00140DC611|nr:hypothetical protein [Neobacillus terrae]NHM29398.1 hypothetical protein [Neobacillus terrae]
MQLMTIGKDSNKETLILSRIDNYISQKRSKDASMSKPGIIKKSEIEDFIEWTARELAIGFNKKCHSTNTSFQFIFENQTLILDILYRYGNYYTRHNISSS